MELDLRTLRTFHEMAQRGAEEAADRLTEFTGVETELGVTKIKFVTTTEIQNEFDVDTEHVAVGTDLAGGPDGHSVVVFDRDSAIEITDAIFSIVDPDALDEENVSLEDDDPASKATVDLEAGNGSEQELRRSALTELSHMLGCAFIDGWANVLDTAIDVSPPEFRSGTSSREVFGNLDRIGEGTELALMFQSCINVVDTEITFTHFLFPSIDELEAALEQKLGDISGFEYEKLIGFDHMVEEGAREAANSMSQLTGRATSVEVRHINFVKINHIPRELDDENRVGVAFTYNGLPSGYLLFLFSEETAEDLVYDLVPTEPDDPFGDLGQSALQELGNIMASGVIDGWANVLNTGIDHSPPEYVHDLGTAIMDPIVAEIGQQQEYAFMFDTLITAEDGTEYDVSIFSICEHGSLEEALSQLDMDQLHKARETPSFPLEGVDRDPESIESVNTEI